MATLATFVNTCGLMSAFVDTAVLMPSSSSFCLHCCPYVKFLQILWTLLSLCQVLAAFVNTGILMPSSGISGEHWCLDVKLWQLW